MDDFHCSFCGRKGREARKLISSQRVLICDGCVDRCRAIVGPAPYPDGDLAAHQRDQRCSFCEKRRHEVQAMISGPTALLCNECLDLCEDIIVEELGENWRSGGATRA